MIIQGEACLLHEGCKTRAQASHCLRPARTNLHNQTRPPTLTLRIDVAGGFVFGCHWPLMPALTAELFGLRHFAANQCPISLSTALGSFVLSQQLAGRLYQSHVPPGEPACFGKYCFR